MAGLTDADLYDRGTRTLAASWQAYAGSSMRAAVIRSAGAAVAVFPDLPERAFLNNTLLERELGPAMRGRAVRRRLLYVSAEGADITLAPY